MKSFIEHMWHLQREEGLMLVAIMVASLAGMLGTAVFLNWTQSFDNSMGGIRPFVISVAATLVYSAVMGGIVFVLHPQKGLIANIVKK